MEHHETRKKEKKENLKNKGLRFNNREKWRKGFEKTTKIGLYLPNLNLK